MDDPVDNWFQREFPPPCRCCGLVGAHCDCFVATSETDLDLEPTNLITATDKVDLPDFLTLDVVLCQPVGILPAKPTCFMGAVKQRETVVKLKPREPIAGRIFQATDSGHDWFTLVVDFGASKTSTPCKSDFVEFHPSSQGLVMDGIVEGCAIGGEGICEFTVVAEDGIKVTLRVQAYFLPSLGSGNRLLSPQGIKTTDGNYGIRHHPCNADDPLQSPGRF